MDFLITTKEIYDRNSCENCVLYGYPEEECQKYCPKDANYILKIEKVTHVNFVGARKTHIRMVEDA